VDEKHTARSHGCLFPFDMCTGLYEVAEVTFAVATDCGCDELAVASGLSVAGGVGAAGQENGRHLPAVMQQRQMQCLVKACTMEEMFK